MRINKLICLALLCALCVGETWAQRGKRAMNRIDREVQETVFIPKGTWMAGGTVSYSEHDEGNLNFLVLKNVEEKATTSVSVPTWVTSSATTSLRACVSPTTATTST